MANFYVHEDNSTLVENVRPKNLQPSKVFPGQTKKTRSALQPLCGYQQKNKIVKSKEATKIMKLTEKIVLEPPISNELITLKPVFKKVNLIPRLKNVEREYEDEIWMHIKKLEQSVQAIKPYYMLKQVHLNWEMRSVLIDWLVGVADEYKLSENTLYLSVNYLDRFLSNISVIRGKFQLVGATAMMLASKVEDIYPPDLQEWSFLTGDAFTVRQIIKMEQLMLKVLNFEMNAPTILDFLKHLCCKQKIDSKTMHLAMYLSELVLLEGDEYLQHYPSKLASAALVLARHTLYKAQPWTKTMEESVGYSLKELSPVVEKQHKTFKSSPFKEQQEIQKKYSSEKYQKVALIKPRILVLDVEE